VALAPLDLRVVAVHAARLQRPVQVVVVVPVHLDAVVVEHVAVVHRAVVRVVAVHRLADAVVLVAHARVAVARVRRRARLVVARHVLAHALGLLAPPHRARVRVVALLLLADALPAVGAAVVLGAPEVVVARRADVRRRLALTALRVADVHGARVRVVALGRVAEAHTADALVAGGAR